jgi:glyoxylase-like metal-dependent hydrolase (beta-lactamase superfamily II)
MLGGDPDKIEDVIISHMHYDHCGDLSSFPNAKFYLQDREMSYCTGRCMMHAPLRHPYAVDYVVNMVRLVYDDRVQYVDGEMQIAPGISVHHIGGHTDGVQSVRVWTRKGWLVLASDATHFYDNMAIPNPFPIVYNVGDMLDGYEKLRSLADGNEDKVIPGHDPQVLTLFPAASKELEGIAVALHEDPIGDMDKVWRRTK